LAVVLGVVAVVVLGSSVAIESSAGIGLAIATLAAQYVVSALDSGSAVDARAPIVGAGLLLIAELAHWSIELRTPIRDEPSIYAARARAIALLVVASAGVAVVPLLVAALPPAGHPVLRVAGAGAAVCTVAVLVWLTWRGGPGAQRDRQHG